MAVVIEDGVFDPWQALQNHQSTLGAASYGATAVFVGSMRDFNQGDEVQGMTLEHYPGMTEKQLELIAAEASREWPLIDSLIHHRVGRVHPAEPIVLTAVWSVHRMAAFEANRYIMEELKSRASFWKRETLRDGRERWVEKNTPGY